VGIFKPFNRIPVTAKMSLEFVSAGNDVSAGSGAFVESDVSARSVRTCKPFGKTGGSAAGVRFPEPVFLARCLF